MRSREMLDSVAQMFSKAEIATRLISCPRMKEAGFLMVARGHPDPRTAYLVALILTSEAQGQSLGVAVMGDAVQISKALL